MRHLISPLWFMIMVTLAVPTWALPGTNQARAWALVDCLNRVNGHPRESYSVEGWDDTFADFVTVEEELAVIVGRVGNHATWVAVVDLTDSRPEFFETYDEANGDGRILFRSPINDLVQSVFQNCGATFGGQFASEVPERRHFAEGSLWPEPEDVPHWFEDLRADELLPPR